MAPIDTESSPTGGMPDSPGPVAPGRLLAIALVAGLLAGTAATIAGESIIGPYLEDLQPKIERHPSEETIRRWREARLYSGALTFGMAGGCLGLAMGLAGGLARRSARASALAGAAGLAMGAAVVGGLSLLMVANFYDRYDPRSDDLMLPLLTHGAILSAAGAIGGLAIGLGLGGRGRWGTAALGGLAGGMAAAVLYEVVGALAFPTVRTDLPLSATLATRAMAHLLLATLAAAGAALALRPARRDRAALVPSGDTVGDP